MSPLEKQRALMGVKLVAESFSTPTDACIYMLGVAAATATEAGMKREDFLYRACMLFDQSIAIDAENKK